MRTLTFALSLLALWASSSLAPSLAHAVEDTNTTTIEADWLPEGGNAWGPGRGPGWGPGRGPGWGPGRGPGWGPGHGGPGWGPPPGGPGHGPGYPPPGGPGHGPGYPPPGGPGWGNPPPPPPPAQQYVSCGSSDYRFNRCFVNGRIRGAQLVRQRSSSACVLGQSWGYEHNSVWVDRGCRGEFVVYLGW